MASVQNRICIMNVERIVGIMMSCFVQFSSSVYSPHIIFHAAFAVGFFSIVL
jgi:hypothetical protein